MDKKDVIQIINKEGLQGYNINEKRENKENEVVLKCKSGKWFVYATDERASKITGSENIFNTEEEALENFLKRLRAFQLFRKKLL